MSLSGHDCIQSTLVLKRFTGPTLTVPELVEEGRGFEPRRFTAPWYSTPIADHFSSTFLLPTRYYVYRVLR